ncbi:MAG TPA: SH3 domain-containing protein, partial [Thermomicrobiales bacterium]|nr:SH3 domain-containing protein [Thermomicrobiales bacterium]
GATASTQTEPETPSEPLNAAAGDVVEVGSDPLNLRADASTDGAIVVELAPGTQLTVIGDVVEAEGHRWYPVEVPESGESGFVAEDFIVPAGG